MTPLPTAQSVEGVWECQSNGGWEPVAGGLCGNRLPTAFSSGAGEMRVPEKREQS